MFTEREKEILFYALYFAIIEVDKQTKYKITENETDEIIAKIFIKLLDKQN